MRSPTQILEILRDFVEVHLLVHELAERHQAQGLRFEAVAGLIQDDERSVLFRLKERTHAQYRPRDGEGRAPTHREALFDLAVGSLFHEAMKLRENLYQREIYGPRVRALHSEAAEESKALFDEFERMLGAVDARVDEGVQELVALGQRTADQLQLLIARPPDDAATRFLTEHPDTVEAVFGVSLSDQLEVMYGSEWKGYERAGRSYLESGFFSEAAARFERALEMTPDHTGLQAFRDFAGGMQAYINRDYSAATAQLGAWARANAEDPELRVLARDAAASIVLLADGDERERVTREAKRLRDQLADPDRA